MSDQFFIIFHVNMDGFFSSKRDFEGLFFFLRFGACIIDLLDSYQSSKYNLSASLNGSYVNDVKICKKKFQKMFHKTRILQNDIKDRATEKKLLKICSTLQFYLDLIYIKFMNPNLINLDS